MFDTTQQSHRDFREIVKERTSPIIAWTGSGLSVQAGGPTWLGLRDALAQALRNKVDSISDGAEHLRSKLATANKSADAWVAFEILKEALGATTYRDVIRTALQPAADVRQVPEAYQSLWRMGINGVLNLNLDRLAGRAFSAVNPGLQPQDFIGSQAVPNAASILKNPNGNFIVNLHGVANDESSWVLTHSQLRQLTSLPGYQELLVGCLTTRTVLFVGVTADDVAVGGHLERLAALGINSGPHFWLTDRRDLATDQWAERVGIRIIRYEADKTHSAVNDFFRDIAGYLPPEPVAPPVRLSNPADVVDVVPAPDELVGKNAEFIRATLNAKAAAILRQENEEAYFAYEQFSKEYDEAIYRAWYVTPTAPQNHLLGHLLIEEVGSGTFGTVYRAETKDREQVALKVLNQQVRKDPEMLQSFRRGVRSMKLLSKAGVQGMVPYRDASEIPAFVVMDWIEGPTLRQAVEARHFDSWRDLLFIALQLSQILRNAHALPERILHRDVRPDNVMLADYYVGSEWRVVMLDFDLSWHMGSVERSFIHRAQTTGYLAPEQMQQTAGVSTRNAAVDSFGLGMTLFYLVSGRDPLPTEHKHNDWKQTLDRICRTRECVEWASLPQRVARLIRNCTRDGQSRRWDMTQICNELGRLNEIVAGNAHGPAVDMLSEEIAARVESGRGYTWSDDERTASLQLSSGVHMRIAADEPSGYVRLTIDWMSEGLESRKQIGRWLPEASRAVVGILTSSGWTLRANSTTHQAMHLEASIGVGEVMSRDISHVSSTVDRVASRLTFQ